MTNSAGASSWRMLLAATLTISLLAGCRTLGTGTTRYVDTSCEAFGPLTYSTREDSAETVEGIKAHNRVYDALCPAR